MTPTVLVRICSLILLLKIPESAVRLTKAEAQSVSLKQAWFQKKKETCLLNHVYKRKQTDNEFACSLSCARNESCRSVNYKTSGNDKGLCELNTGNEKSEVERKVHDTEFNFLAKIIQVS